MAGLLDLLGGLFGGDHTAPGQPPPMALPGAVQQAVGTAPVQGGPLPAQGMAAPITQSPQGGSAPPSAVPPDIDPNAVTVTARRPTPTSAGAYDNSEDVAAARAGLAKDAALPGAGPGYGNDTGIPAALGMHSGTLRNLLGTLGDAFLIQSGHQPIHQQAAANQQMADAAVGFQNNPGVAASRIMATAVPGSMEMGDKMFNTAQTMDLRKAEQQNLNNYRSSQVQNRQDVLHDRQVQQSMPIVSGILKAGATAEQTAPGSYTKAYAAAQKYAAARGLDVDQDFGAPSDVKDYQAGYGMTAQQQAQADSRSGNLAERTQHDRANEGIGQQNAGSNAVRARASVASAGKATSATEQARVTNALNANGGDISKLPPGDQIIANNLKNGKPSAGKAKLNIPGLTNPTPTPSDRAYVQAHPEARAAFVKHFGVNP